MKKLSLTLIFSTTIVITALATTRPAQAACPPAGNPNATEQYWIEHGGHFTSNCARSGRADKTVGGAPVYEVCCDPTVWTHIIKQAIPTGLGIFSTAPQGLIADFLSITTKIAGGVALLLLVSGGIKIITTQGDPKAFDAAKGTVTRAISGLLLVVLAVFVMKFIGYDILQLPGWKDSGGDLELPQ